MSESTLLLSKESTGSPLKMPSLVLSAVQRKFVTGVVLLLCVVVLWTASSFITSDLLGGGYDKPFL
jgi:solute carrier family 35 protein F5